MARRPPKPDGQAPAPRFIAAEDKHTLAMAIESSRRLTSYVDFSYEAKKLVAMDDRAIAILKGAHVENYLQLALRFFLNIRKEEERNMFKVTVL